MTTEREAGWSPSLRAGLLWGTVQWVVSAVLWFPSESLALASGLVSRLNLFLYSACVWILGFTILDLLVRRVVGAALRARAAGFLGAWLRALPPTAIVVGGAVLWRAFEVTPPLLPREYLVDDLRGGALLAILATLVASGLLAALLSIPPLRSAGPATLRAPWRWATALAAVYFVGANLVGVVNGGGGDDPATDPPPIVLLGLDAGSWNVLLPLLEEGELPTLTDFVREGAAGYLATHGKQFTPPSWTTIATGVSADRHGVRDFGAGSHDWQAPAIWSAFSSRGKDVAVANWICAWPPFDVQGAFVSRGRGTAADRVRFSAGWEELREPAERILGEAEPAPGMDRATRLTAMRQEAALIDALDREVLTPVDADLTVTYFRSTDVLQHYYGADATKDEVREVWRAADDLLAKLVERHGPDASYVVVSDHGGRATRTRAVDFDRERLLEELGLLVRVDGEIDAAASLCTVPAGGPPHRMRITIRPDAYRSGEAIDEGRYREIAKTVADRLRDARFEESGESLFPRIRTREEPGRNGEADLVVVLSRAALDLSSASGAVRVGDGVLPADELLREHPWVGRHRARGILLARGPGIRRTFLASWMMDDAILRFVRVLRGNAGAVDALVPVLRGFHLVDPASTLDVTPTILHLAALPVSREMEGRVLEAVLTPEVRARPVAWVDTYELGGVTEAEVDAEAEAQRLEQLRALGYVN